MEKRLFKNGLYGFILPFAVLFAYMDRTRTIQIAPNTYTSETLTYADYFLKLTRYSVRISLSVIIITFIVLMVKENRKNKS